MKIGWIGLGRMGAPMAKNLLKAGHELTVYDAFPDNDLFTEFERLGASIGHNSQEMGNADVAWLMIPYKEVEAAADKVAEGMNKRNSGRKIIIDGGNSDPRTSRKVAEKMKHYGISFLDAGCGGGVEKANEGSMTIMVGGDIEAYETALPLFEILGMPEYMGPSGSGHLTKMIHNCLEQIYMMGIGEMIAFSKKVGLCPKEVGRAINQGLCQSRLLELYLQIPEEDIEKTAPHISGGDYSRMALEISNEEDFALPFTGLTYEMRKLSRADRYDSFSIQSQLRREFGQH